MARPRRDRDRDRGVGLTSRDKTETRRLQVSRRDRDVEMHIVINAVVNKLTYAQLLSLLSWCIPDFSVFNSSDYRLFLCHYSLLVLVDEKMNFVTPCFRKLSRYINTETDVMSTSNVTAVRTMKNAVYSGNVTYH